jgi:hypothetical protein
MKASEMIDDVVTFTEIKRAKENNDLGRLHEVSLNRAWQHFQGTKTKGFVIITGYRNENTSKQNKDANKRLAADVRAAGLGFAKMKGAWPECQEPGVAYKDCPQDKIVEVSEPCYLIPGATLAQAKDWVKKYNQDAAVYHGEDAGGKTLLVTKTGIDDLGTGFRPDKVARSYSRIKGHTFVLEWVQQGGWGESLILHYVSKIK